mmetsp:Transcript_30249/g.61621  ORF Transcript_30249/g.61621 Transcript_30249/m.61621 type:complete len:235 (+) Transcript_30249:109-813(+)
MASTNLEAELLPFNKIVITPAVDEPHQTALAEQKIFACALPFLPPRDQQLLAQNRIDSDTIKHQIMSVKSEPSAVVGGQVSIGSIVLAPLGKLNAAEISAAIQSTSFFKRRDLLDDSSAFHDVEQGKDPAALIHRTFQLSQKDMLSIQIAYNKVTRIVNVSPNMTGLQFKSMVIAAFELDGGFQNYFLTLDGMPFGSRASIREHPCFASGSAAASVPVASLEDVGTRSKAVGHT